MVSTKFITNDSITYEKLWVLVQITTIKVLYWYLSYNLIVTIRQRSLMVGLREWVHSQNECFSLSGTRKVSDNLIQYTWTYLISDVAHSVLLKGKNYQKSFCITYTEDCLRCLVSEGLPRYNEYILQVLLESWMVGEGNQILVNQYLMIDLVWPMILRNHWIDWNDWSCPKKRASYPMEEEAVLEEAASHH